MKKEIRSKGIDVSRWNKVNWDIVAESGEVDFAMLRVGGWEDVKYADSTFEQNYKDCKRLGIYVGAYYMLPPIIKDKYQAITTHLLSLIDAKVFEYPIALDVELQKAENREDTTTGVREIAELLQQQGYYVSIYSSSNLGFKTLLDASRLEAYDKWVAQWSQARPDESMFYGMWQRSNKGRIPGITGDIDINSAYLDYPEIMRKNGLNNFNTEDDRKCHCGVSCKNCRNNNCKLSNDVRNLKGE